MRNKEQYTITTQLELIAGRALAEGCIFRPWKEALYWNEKQTKEIVAEFVKAKPQLAGELIVVDSLAFQS